MAKSALRALKAPRDGGRLGRQLGAWRERLGAGDDGGHELVAVVGAEARIGLDHSHERPVAVPLLSDQAAGARRAHVILGLVVAPVLIDAEDASVDRPLAFEILLAVAIDVDRRALDQRLVRILFRGADMRADGPGLVLAKGDARRALRIHGIHRIRLTRLRCRDPGLNERLAVRSDRENDSQVLERVRRLRIKGSIRIDALDIDDVLAVGMAADEVTLLLHVSDDAV